MAFPLVLQAAELATFLAQRATANANLSEAGVRLVDCRKLELYEAAHIPGALHCDAALLNRSESPVGGLLPEPDTVAQLLRSVGARMGDHIVAYDAGLETAAARLIWVLDAYGYEASSWLNGGFKSWLKAGHPTSTDREQAGEANLSPSMIGHNLITVDQLKDSLQSQSFHILDVRSEAEFAGTDVRSAFGGHVPGARHLEWTRLLNEDGSLLEDEQLESLLQGKTGSKDDTVIVYCQTHQRSAVTYVALKHLGFTDVRAIDGAWSNWGNREDTPKETGA